MREISAALVLIAGALIMLVASQLQGDRSFGLALIGFLVSAVGFGSWCVAFFRGKHAS
jgi:hypothetical protein